MAAKKRSVTPKATPKKKTSKKKAAAPAPAKRAPKPKPLPLNSAPEMKLVDVSSLTRRPKKQRVSALDPAIRLLLDAPEGKAFVFPVQPGKKIRAQRTMLYPRISRILERLAPERNLRPSLAVLADGNISVTLVKK